MLTTDEKLKLMAEIKENIVNYLTGQQSILISALAVYDNDAIKDADSEIRKMREAEAIKLRDRLTELNRHIAVIKLM